jgi:hypothetical protein
LKNQSIRKKETQKNIQKIKIKLSKSYKCPKKGCKRKRKQNIQNEINNKNLSEEKEGKETTFYLKTQTP